MKQRRQKRGRERSWAELCCFACDCLQLSWPRILLRKWLNAGDRDSDFSADEEGNSGSEIDFEDVRTRDREILNADWGMDRLVSTASTSESVRLRRRKSETLRAQYIDSKELRVCVGTWNAAGRSPPDDLDIEKWLDMEDPADIYVLGFQEVVPLNAGNIFGVENSEPVVRWESIIREKLDMIVPARGEFKCHTDPPSPSRSKAPENTLTTMNLLSLTDSDSDDGEVPPLNEESFDLFTSKTSCTTSAEDSGHNETVTNSDSATKKLGQSSSKVLHRLNHFNLTGDGLYPETSVSQQNIKPERTLSNSERIGLSWPEQPLDLLPPQYVDNSKYCMTGRSLPSCNTHEFIPRENKIPSETGLFSELNKKGFIVQRRKRSAFARIMSKQMVGIFLSVWVRQSLQKHIQNLRVSAVGLGLMGCIGNKGSISVSMSIYQTTFCFICSHLTSGEKDGDELRRNANVQEILHRTQFSSVPGISLPRTIYEHERIVWLGDLNYRINIPYEKALELIFEKELSKLAEMDQLRHELKKGRTFDGWTEGVLNFPPTYKYEFNSEKYVGDDTKTGRRTPAWCDRILSYGKGIRLLKYKRSELRFSDHRPVTAIYKAEVEVFCHRKLQKALTFTDAEIEDSEILSDICNEQSLNHPRLDEEVPLWSCRDRL